MSAIVGACASCARPVYDGPERPIRTCYCIWQADRRRANGGELIAADASRPPVRDHGGGWGWLGVESRP